MLRKLAAILLLAAPQAHAGLIIDTSVGTYEVSTIFTSFDSSSSLLSSQVWWDDLDLAVEFATNVGTGLGVNGAFGPLFAALFISGAQGMFAVGSGWCDGAPACVPAGIYFVGARSGVSTYYAVASQVPEQVPEPGAAHLFVVGVFSIGWLRFRRRTA